jgi:hypothetical protein
MPSTSISSSSEECRSICASVSSWRSLSRWRGKPKDVEPLQPRDDLAPAGAVLVSILRSLVSRGKESEWLSLGAALRRMLAV